MATLRETKDRIASVRSTLKITGAMKLVASAKLRKAQQAVEAMLPYQRELQATLRIVQAALPKAAPEQEPFFPETTPETGRRTALVLVSSNSSLCGAFNANAIRCALEQIRAIETSGAEVDVYALGRKGADALRKLGHPSLFDGIALVAHPAYEGASALAAQLMEAHEEGRYDRVLLVYNHFVSSASQQTRCETWLPFEPEHAADGVETADPEAYIMEPSARELHEKLLPQLTRLNLYTVLLDSVAAEHAARTIAMQTATDNAERLLSELTLEYNKGRQQKITAEILDLMGGAQ
ncbi:MAG: ATP synthase F1 subunit gamma [Bacteroidales bacterium]|nr:ATP synthase F1 subunit gamma [Bacteroidales bacterium]